MFKYIRHLISGHKWRYSCIERKSKSGVYFRICTVCGNAER